MSPDMEKDNALLIDVYALVYRAFFALPPLTTSSGTPVNNTAQANH